MSRVVIADRFELQSHAGQGGMGSVYRALDLATERPVAVKVLTQGRPLDIVRFKREAEVLATLSHPNVVDYVAHGESNGVRYLVQEWVDGVTLGALHRGAGITAREAVDVAIGVARALEATHALGIIHRDVKPSNIILVGGGVTDIKLVDFGVARAQSDAGVVTRTGVMVGTPSYMAPEQALGIANIETPADLWALGCVLYEGLTGRVAFAGKTPTAIRAKVLLGDTLALGAQCPEAPRELLVLVDDLLRKEPKDRLQSGKDAVARLLALPAIPGGPRRRVGGGEPATVVMPMKRKLAPEDVAGASCYVLVASSDDEEVPARDLERVADVAKRHDLQAHTFEDGSTLLSADAVGKRGAAAVARAAAELCSGEFDGAVTVFGKAFGDTFDAAMDRGSVMLEKALVRSVFADLEGGSTAIPIDDVIADLIASEGIPIDNTEHGPVLAVGRAKP